MKVMEILNGVCHREYPEYKDATEARKFFSDSIHFVDAPNWVWPGYGYNPNNFGDKRFLRPELGEGWVYDDDGHPWNPEQSRSSERSALHAETTNDTLQALRKIREGDTTIDWEAWLRALDDYNVAIEETRNQPDYPLKVVYPEYPQKPTA